MKKLFALLTLILTAATLARSGRDGERAYLYDPLPVILPEGINHLLDNSQSELEEMKGFDRVVERFMQRWEITGASIAVMKNGRLLYSKGYGWADKERNVRTDVKHIFRIASLSKLITATGIMKLQEDGLLSLEDRVFGEQGILCDSAFREIRDRRIEKITVEHLLRHQGGYSIRAGDPLFCSVSVARQLGIRPPVSFDDMVRYAAQTRLRYEPGSSNVYSNLGYVVLTKVIEKVSGMPYEKFIQDSILSPIGCHDMHIGHSFYEMRFPNEVRYYEPADTEPVEPLRRQRPTRTPVLRRMRPAGTERSRRLGRLAYGTDEVHYGHRSRRLEARHSEAPDHRLHDREGQKKVPDRLDENHRKRRLVAHRLALGIERAAQTAARRIQLGVHHEHEFVVGLAIHAQDFGDDEAGYEQGQTMARPGPVLRRTAAAFRTATRHGAADAYRPDENRVSASPLRQPTAHIAVRPRQD